MFRYYPFYCKVNGTEAKGLVRATSMEDGLRIVKEELPTSTGHCIYNPDHYKVGMSFEGTILNTGTVG